MRPRVVLIDDDELLLAGLRRSLHVERAKYDLEFHHEPHAALAACRENPPDIAIVDLNMPDISGIDVLAELRARGPTSQLILLSGHCDLGAAKRAINEIRVFGVLDKPCSARELSNWLACAAAALPKPALHTQSVPIISLSTSSGKLVDANPMGRDILAQRDGLHIDPGGLCRAADHPATTRLLRFIRRQDGDTRFLALPRPSGRRDLALVLNVTEPEDDIAILNVREPDRMPEVDSDMLTSLFGLTPSEAALVERLIEHHELIAAAEACGLTEASARTYLKKIFHKMNVRRQTELLALVFSAAIAPA